MESFDFARRRLLSQRIGAEPLTTPNAVVTWLCAVQAQDYFGAAWALGLRMPHSAAGVIEQAFTAGAILRTHLLRPTWHFVTPDDIRWLLALTAPRVHAANALMYRRSELDRDTLSRSGAALEKALRGGGQATRDELRLVLNQAGVAVDGGLRLTYLMMAAELDGILCSGARRGKQFTYALLDERAPLARTLERDEALAELAARFFASRGPAAVQDLAKWSGLTISDARRGLEAVKNQLESEEFDGQVYWFSKPLAAAETASPTAYLLSIYDEYISGYKDRSAMASVEIGKKLVAMANDLAYIIVLDGQIVGTWKRLIKKETVIVMTNLFVQLTTAEHNAVAAAAQCYADFHGLALVLE